MNKYEQFKNEDNVEYLIRLVKILKEEKPDDLEWADIVNYCNLNVSHDTLRKAMQPKFFGAYDIYNYAKNSKQQESTNYNNTEKHSINQDGTETNEKIIKTTNCKNLKNIDFLLKEHGYDSSIFELIKSYSSRWNVFSNSQGMQDLYSSKIVVKKKEIPLDLNTMCIHFLESVSKIKPETYNEKHDIRNKSLTLEIPLMDVHYGKLCWNSETNSEYNHKITENLLWNVINKTLNRINTQEIKKIIFPIGNDFFNSDTTTNTTTNGTPQVNDIRWQKMYLKGFNIVVDVLNRLSTIAPVHVLYVPGNHDKMSSFFLMTYLYAWFKDCNNVFVDKDVKERKYIQFGNNLIGFAHKLPKPRNKTIMQQEARKYWGKSKYCEFHCAHLHSEQVIEEGGVIIRHVSSIVGTDNWHYDNGYTGSVRKLQNFLWDDEEGLINVMNVVV